MKQVKINVGTQHHAECNMPESWDEVTPSEFVFAANHPVEEDKVPCALIAHLLHLPADVEFFMTPIHYHAIHEENNWLDTLDSISQWMLPCIRLSDGREMFPPHANFDNITWEEFIFADELAQRGRWAAVAACLYRPENPHAGEDESRRTPFTREGVKNRLPLFQQLNPAVINAVGVNYLALRKRMTKKYRHLFVKGTGESKSAGWVETSRSILGENVWHESDLMRTSVNQVLYRLDHEVKEAKERKRYESRRK